MDKTTRKQFEARLKAARSYDDFITLIREFQLEDRLLDERFIQQCNEKNPKFSEAIEYMENSRSEIEMDKYIEEHGGLAYSIDVIKSKGLMNKYRQGIIEEAEKYMIEGDSGDNKSYELARKLYKAIADEGPGRADKFNARRGREDDKNTNYLRAKFNYYVCKAKMGENLTKEDIAELEKLGLEDKYNQLGLRGKGQSLSYTLFMEYFGDTDVSIEELADEVVKKSDPTGITRRKGDGHAEDKEYDEEVSVESRFQFLREGRDNVFIKSEKRMGHVEIGKEVDRVRRGRGTWSDYFLITFKDSDVVLLEKFFETDRSGVEKQAYGAATYILHKEADIDFENLKISDLREKKKEGGKEGLIDHLNHRSSNGSYYDRLVTSFKRIEERGIAKREGRLVLEKDSSDKEGKKGENIESAEQKRIEELRARIASFEAEIARIIAERESLKTREDEIATSIAEITNIVSQCTMGRFTKEDAEKIMDTLKMNLELRESYMVQLEEIEETRERLDKEEKDNREKRDKAQKELDDILND